MTDADRLRDLQRKAYAVDGSLTDAEAAELRALTGHPATDGTGTATSAAAAGATAAEAAAADEAAAAQTAAVPTSVAPTSVSDTDAAGGPGTEASAPTAPGTTAPGTAASGTEASAPTAPGNRSWSIALTAAVVALLMGVGVGWFAFGRPPAPPAMSTDESAVQEILDKSGEYDPGSLRYEGSKDGASVWVATKDDGRQRCLVLSVRDDRAAECAVVDDALRQSGQVPVNLNASSDGESWMYWAVVLENLRGERAVVLQRDRDLGAEQWQDQYTPEQLPLAQAIVDTGVHPQQIYIVGTDGDRPIWLSVSTPRCIYVVDPQQLFVTQQCEDQSEGLALSIGTTTYRVSEARYGATLTIERDGNGAHGE